ncbi:hypothetical protein KIPB_007902 [Kipferlia bialata]|uniref:Uncharacterized protein n=1 Tax=Kipferlia bialata TaxID=797122 RepID=A0A9K3GKF3_9EUKA|nr:hypothetical protein KIPB_007902 [Kipferlia bialata]|eukprot:g7902.t1
MQRAQATRAQDVYERDRERADQGERIDVIEDAIIHALGTVSQCLGPLSIERETLPEIAQGCLLLRLVLGVIVHHPLLSFTQRLMSCYVSEGVEGCGVSTDALSDVASTIYSNK